MGIRSEVELGCLQLGACGTSEMLSVSTLLHLVLCCGCGSIDTITRRREFELALSFTSARSYRQWSTIAAVLAKQPCRCPNPPLQARVLRTAVVNSVGSAACLRCWPIGESGVLRVGMLLVVNRRCSCPRASLEEGPIWAPTARRGLAREENDDSSRGDLRPLRSPMPDEKAILLEIHCGKFGQRAHSLRPERVGWAVGGEDGSRKGATAGACTAP